MLLYDFSMFLFLNEKYFSYEWYEIRNLQSIFFEVATEYIGTFYMAAILFMVTHIFAEVM